MELFRTTRARTLRRRTRLMPIRKISPHLECALGEILCDAAPIMRFRPAFIRLRRNFARIPGAGVTDPGKNFSFYERSAADRISRSEIGGTVGKKFLARIDEHCRPASFLPRQRENTGEAAMLIATLTRFAVVRSRNRGKCRDLSKLSRAKEVSRLTSLLIWTAPWTRGSKRER